MLVIFIINIIGCATILKEKQAKVKIESEPQGAEIYKLVGGMFGDKREVRIGRTPATMTFSNRSSVGLIFKKDGYEESNYIIRSEPQGGWMIASLACFIFPAIIDFVTRNAWSLKDKEVKVTLDPVLPKQADQVTTKK